MKILHLLIIICCCLILFSCDISANIKADHEPVLQVDAVIYSGQPLPVIEIKRSFNVSGRSTVEIGLESLMVSGATVFFTHNGNPVSIEEKSPGRYLPVSEELPEKGDSFYIEVMWEGKAVSATARIPDYPVEEMVV